MDESRPALTAEVLRDLLVHRVQLDDPDFWLEQFLELVPVLGNMVFSLEWDSGGPGAGAGTESVYRLGDKYLACSPDWGWTGPYDSLADAVGTIFVSGATREIDSSEWTDEEIIARMQIYGPAMEIIINGNPWPWETLEHRWQILKDGCG